MKNKIDIYFRRSFLIIISIWLVFGFSFIAYKVLRKNYTFAATDKPGDGIGTIAEIGFLKSQHFLHNDNSKIIDSLMVVPNVYKDNWWVLKQFLALVFSPDNVYDFLVLSFWPLNFIAGYYLFRTLKLDHFSSIIFGLVLAGLDVFQSRISVHLTLSAIFIPILQIAFAFKLMESPMGKTIYIFSILCFASFLSNEYYGYFGFIFSITLIVSYFLVNLKRLKEFHIKELMIGILIFCSGMVMVYANIFRTLINHDSTRALIVHSYGEFIFNSVRNPLEIFYSSRYGPVINLYNPDEFTFHLGIFILIFIITLALFAVIRKIRVDINLVLPTLFSGLILELFGLNPNFPLSLEKITYTFAPQFRVGARAFLWVDFTVLIIAAILFNSITQAQFAGNPKNPALINVGLSFSLLLILVDTTMGFYIKGPRLYPLPENPAYKAISDYPQGLLLELPFYGPADAPEPSYRYEYNYFDHKKMLVNYPSSMMDQYDPILASSLDRFKLFLNNPDTKIIDLLRRAGIKYIAVSDSQIKRKFDNMDLEPVVYLDGVAIYDFEAVNEFDLKSLVLCNNPQVNLNSSVQQSNQRSSLQCQGLIFNQSLK